MQIDSERTRDTELINSQFSRAPKMSAYWNVKNQCFFCFSFSSSSNILHVKSETDSVGGERPVFERWNRKPPVFQEIETKLEFSISFLVGYFVLQMDVHVDSSGFLNFILRVLF